jgi:hypothetical protein
MNEKLQVKIGDRVKCVDCSGLPFSGTVTYVNQYSVVIQDDHGLKTFVPMKLVREVVPC